MIAVVLLPENHVIKACKVDLNPDVFLLVTFHVKKYKPKKTILVENHKSKASIH